MLRRITPALHRLDHAIGRLSPRRDVLIEMRTPVYEAVLGPMARALALEPDVHVWYTSEYPERLRALVPSDRLLTHDEVEWRRFDLYLNADPWAAARLRRCARRANFFHGVAGKYDLDNPADLPMGFNYYDRVAFINRDRMERYLAARVVTRAQAVLVGYPKLDALARGSVDGGTIRRALALDEFRPTALYAPTYSTASSLHLAGERIVSTLAAEGFNVIVKLHDRSLDADPRYTGGVDWRARFRAMEEPGRVVYVESPDATPLLAAADVMVTDHSSIGFEYLILDRPLIVFDAPELASAARINPEKIALLRRAAAVVGTCEELGRVAIQEMVEPGRRSAERRQVAGEMFFEPGNATDRALALMIDLLRAAPRHARRAEMATGGAG